MMPVEISLKNRPIRVRCLILADRSIFLTYFYKQQNILLAVQPIVMKIYKVVVDIISNFY